MNQLEKLNFASALNSNLKKMPLNPSSYSIRFTYSHPLRKNSANSQKFILASI